MEGDHDVLFAIADVGLEATSIISEDADEGDFVELDSVGTKGWEDGWCQGGWRQAWLGGMDVLAWLHHVSLVWLVGIRAIACHEHVCKAWPGGICSPFDSRKPCCLDQEPSCGMRYAMRARMLGRS